MSTSPMKSYLTYFPPSYLPCLTLSCLIPLYRTLSCPIPLYQILSCPIPLYQIPSCPIPLYQILSCLRVGRY
jgi:hypothetical protein